MSKNIFLDFAETLGYRYAGDLRSDKVLIQSQLRLPSSGLDDLLEKWGSRLSIYEPTPFLFSSLGEEINHYEKFFTYVLSDALKEVGDGWPRLLAEKKLYDLRHNLFDDSLDLLQTLNDSEFNSFVVTDGKPSRRITMKKLGVENLVDGIYISDELGALKTEKGFYEKLEKRSLIDFNVDSCILVDDNGKCLKTASDFGITSIQLKRGGNKEEGRGCFPAITSLKGVLNFL